MKHVEINGAKLQDLMNSFSQLLWVPLNHRFFPAGKPAIPEFHTHQGPFLAVFVKEFLHLTEVIGCFGTEVSRHEEIFFDQGSCS